MKQANPYSTAASYLALMTLVCVLLAGSASSQIISGRPVARSYTEDLKLLQSNLRRDINQVMRANFVLPRDEAEAFWPLYMDYAREQTVLWDARQELIEEFMRKRARLTETEAQALMDRLFALDDRTIKLRKRYFRRIKREVSATVAFRFMQLDRRLNNLVEIQIAREVPLAQ